MSKDIKDDEKEVEKSTRDPKELVRQRRQMMKSGKLHMRPEQKDPGFKYRFAIDGSDRSNIQKYKDFGYVVEDKDIDVGDGTLAEGNSLGTVPNVKAGGGERLVLMKIPNELYEIGLEEKAKDCNKIDEGMLRPKDLESSLTSLTQKTIKE